MAKTSRMAIASLVLGIFAILLGWVPILGWMIVALALGLGIAALVKISKDKTYKGQGMAIAGIVLSAISLSVFVIMQMLVGIGLLSYFGVLSPEMYQLEICVISPKLLCENSAVTMAGEAALIIKNSETSTLYNVDIKINGIDGTCTPSTVPVESKTTCTVRVDPGKPEKLFEGIVTLTYNLGSETNSEVSKKGKLMAIYR